MAIPGVAKDVSAESDRAYLALGAAGVVVVAIANFSAPRRLAPVPVPGNAVAIAASGSYVAVAAEAAGLALVDVSDPPAARIRWQVPIDVLSGTKTRCVATFGDLAFVGTDGGGVTRVEMPTGVLLDAVNLGGDVQDLVVAGDRLYAIANQRLHILAFLNSSLQVVGSTALSSVSADGFTGRRRLAVDGTYACASCYLGWDVVSITNPAAPSLRSAARLHGPNSFKQILPNGSGLGLATVGINPNQSSTHDLYLYDLASVTNNTNFVTSFSTPGHAYAVSLYNGLAYVADGSNGLQVINYLAYDRGTNPPTGTLTTSATNGLVQEGERLLFRADVRDDVQVRNVEFYVNGERYQVDGSFPFEVGWRAPNLAANPSGSVVTVSAIARDTGGNELRLGPITLTLVADTQPPTISTFRLSDTNLLYHVVGDQAVVDLDAYDLSGIAAVEFYVDGVRTTAYRLAYGRWGVVLPTLPGTYQLTVIVRDNAGRAAPPATITIRIRAEAISREMTVFNSGLPLRLEAISRELTVFNGGLLDKLEAISRELTVFNGGLPDKLEAISREVSVDVSTNAPVPAALSPAPARTGSTNSPPTRTKLSQKL